MKLQLPYSIFLSHIEALRVHGTFDTTILIDRIAYDTRKIVHPIATVFFSLQGTLRDGDQFIDEAYGKGIRLFVIRENSTCTFHGNAVYVIVSNPLKSLQLLAHHHRKKFNIPVIGITGSVGKTTVKEWLSHIMSSHFSIIRSPKSYNSQLGVALSLLEINTNHTLAIIEAGISEPGEMEILENMIEPTLGLFTAFGRAHTFHFESKEAHLTEKIRLFYRCTKTWAHSSIHLTDFQQKKIQAHLVNHDTYPDLIAYSPYQDTASIHNLSLVIAIASYFSIPKSSLKERIETLPRLALRMETTEGINQNTIINDTYNLDLDALTHSLEYQLSIAYGKKRVAILATDGLEKSQLTELRLILHKFSLDAVFFVTQDSTVPLTEINNSIVLIKGTRQTQLQRIATLFQLKKHKTRLEINLSAVKHNIGIYQSFLDHSCKILVMVKAASYGSGAVKMAQYLQQIGIHYLGVAYADEGVELRKNGITLPILVMNAEEDGFDDIVEYGLEPSLYSFGMMDQFIKTLINFNKEAYPVHLKFDTGMRRLGFEKQDVPLITQLIQSQPELKVQSVYSHLADADNHIDAVFTKTQIQIFNEICSEIQKSVSFPFLKHLTNSEGTVNHAEAHFDMVRLGIGIYGYCSDASVFNQLRPAITWKSVISQLKSINVGESVGYGRNFIAQRETTIAIIAIGYADGFRRSLSKGIGSIVIQGVLCPVIGNVCMDMTMVDVTGISVKEGDSVEIIGDYQPLAVLAKKMNTIPYEVLTNIAPRVHRIYLEE